MPDRINPTRPGRSAFPAARRPADAKGTLLLTAARSGHGFHMAMTGLIPLLLLLLLGGCAIGPDYQRPSTAMPEAFRYDVTAVDEADWQTARPVEIDPDAWWLVFGDPTLNSLIDQATAANQDIQAALASLRQARAQVREARAAFFPTLSGSGGTSRGANAPGGSVNTVHQAQLQASWELDLWGGVRRSVESGRAGEFAAAADLADVLLSIRAEVAQNYFQLRSLDEQMALYRESIDAFTRSLAITRNQFAAGTVTRVDVAQAEAQLKAAEAEAVDLDLQRRQTENALATLTGSPASSFRVAPGMLDARLPAVAASLPASLLERRPDVAAAEMRVAEANAQIGVARAAYFPTLSLTASGGYQNVSLDRLFTVPSQVWSLGPSLALSLFQGGARLARTDQAIAAWERTSAQYRQTVLQAIQEVEDQLAAVRLLEEEAAQREQAVVAARDAERIFMNQYKAGMVTYLSVVSAQSTALANARQAVSLKGRRFLASVALIRALGGGWHASAMPDAIDRIDTKDPA